MSQNQGVLLSLFAGIGLVANVWFIRVVSTKGDINTFHRYALSDIDMVRTVNVLSF